MYIDILKWIVAYDSAKTLTDVGIGFTWDTGCSSWQGPHMKSQSS